MVCVDLSFEQVCVVIVLVDMCCSVCRTENFLVESVVVVDPLSDTRKRENKGGNRP